MTTTFNTDLLKIAVAKAAIDYIPHGEVIGVGTGSTANYFIDALANIKHLIPAAVASSVATEQRLKAIGLKVITLNDVDTLSVYVDGADEIDPTGAMIKGGGAALTREKIVASVAKQFICIADSSKVVDTLGRFPLPIEIIPMAARAIINKVKNLGGHCELRVSSNSVFEVLVTDNGNYILDVKGLTYTDAKAWETQINQWPGVVTVGLFAQRKADIALIGGVDGVNILTY